MRTRLPVLASRSCRLPLPQAVHCLRKQLRRLKQSLRLMVFLVFSAVRTLAVMTAAAVAAGRATVARPASGGRGCSVCFAARGLTRRRVGAQLLHVPLMGPRCSPVRTRGGARCSRPRPNKKVQRRPVAWSGLLPSQRLHLALLRARRKRNAQRITRLAAVSWVCFAAMMTKGTCLHWRLALRMLPLRRPQAASLPRPVASSACFDLTVQLRQRAARR